jgi:hypothetical protein
MSAFGGKADMTGRWTMSANDPKRTFERVGDMNAVPWHGRSTPFGPPRGVSALRHRAAGGLGHEPAKFLRLPGVGLHLLLRKTALQSQDVLQIFSFGQLVS